MNAREDSSATIGELFQDSRWDARFWSPKYRQLDARLRDLQSRPLGDFVTFITYGQVGQRILEPRGKVRYLQVINIRDTGIDFLVEPYRITIGSHNDPSRSRIKKDDLLFTNNGFSGTQRLVGRCVVVHADYGPVNVSQHVDVIRLKDIDPYYVAAFIRTPSFGQLQVQRLQYGVSSNELSFAQVQAIQIPMLATKAQRAVKEQYVGMADAHDRAMERKEGLHREHGVAGKELEAIAAADRKYQHHAEGAQARYEHLMSALESLLRGEVKTLVAFPA